MATIRFTAAYSRHAVELLSESERDALIRFLLIHPETGDVVAGTGGARKLRWTMSGRGKRGGVRVLHLYLKHRETTWLLDVCAKRDKADLDPSDIRSLHAAVDAIKRLEK
jgi:hypothetical protein